MAAESGSRVQVLYALPDEQIIVDIPFESGMTVSAAVDRSGLTERYPAIAAADLVLGIWGVAVSTDQLVEPGDRIEISRPLQADPREMRREFISDGRVMGGAPGPNRPLKKTGRE